MGFPAHYISNMSQPNDSVWTKVPSEIWSMIFKQLIRSRLIKIDAIAKEVSDPANPKYMQHHITHPLARVNCRLKMEFMGFNISNLTLYAEVFDMDHSKLIHHLNRSKHAYVGFKPAAIRRVQRVGPGNVWREVVIDPRPETDEAILAARPKRKLLIRLRLDKMLGSTDATKVTLDDLALKIYEFATYFIEPGVAEVERSLYRVSYECEPLLEESRRFLLDAVVRAWQMRQTRAQGDMLLMDSLMLMTRAMRCAASVAADGNVAASNLVGPEDGVFYEMNQDDATTTSRRRSSGGGVFVVMRHNFAPTAVIDGSVRSGSMLRVTGPSRLTEMQSHSISSPLNPLASVFRSSIASKPSSSGFNPLARHFIPGN